MQRCTNSSPRAEGKEKKSSAYEKHRDTYSTQEQVDNAHLIGHEAEKKYFQAIDQ